MDNPQVTIDFELYKELKKLGIIHDCKEDVVSKKC